MRSILKRILFGKELPQEYICVPRAMQNAPRLFLIGKEEKDITDHHLLLGYKPLVFGSSINFGEMDIHLQIRQEDTVLAEIGMKKIDGLGDLFLYEGVSAKLQLSSRVRRFFLEQRERLKDKGPSNIELSRSLYKQVIAAYCAPRPILLILVKRSNAFNIFPTDLWRVFQ